MKKKILQLKRETTQKLTTKFSTTKNAIQNKYFQFKIWWNEKWWKVTICAFLAMILYQKDVEFTIGVDQMPIATMSAALSPSPKLTKNVVQYSPKKTQKEEDHFESISKDLPESMWAYVQESNDEQPKVVKVNWKDDNLANTYSNLTYTNPKFATNNSKLSLKRKKQAAYINRFAKVAQTEMQKFGIPASITLAQGLLESNVGESRLAVKNNNHFGVKCFSKRCGKGHCSNFTDDSHKDFFRIYPSPWESYRAHSVMLGGKRYLKLKKLGTKDFRGWAKGLKKAGYATDKRYAKKLINLIEILELDQFDR